MDHLPELPNSHTASQLNNRLNFSLDLTTSDSIHPNQGHPTASSTDPEPEPQPTESSNAIQNIPITFYSQETMATNMNPVTQQQSVPTKPRTIITLPHLLGRQNKSQQQQYADRFNANQASGSNTKTPIIIREKIEPQHSNNSSIPVSSNTHLSGNGASGEAHKPLIVHSSSTLSANTSSPSSSTSSTSSASSSSSTASGALSTSSSSSSASSASANTGNSLTGLLNSNVQASLKNMIPVNVGVKPGQIGK